MEKIEVPCPQCGRSRQLKLRYFKQKGSKRCLKCSQKGINTKHGLADKHPLYWRWQQMLRRCNNPNNKDYIYYGARGIKVCKRWMDFSNFMEDILPIYSPDLTLDRIDNNGDYEPSNIRMATAKEQQHNRRPSGSVRPFKGKLRNAFGVLERI